MRPRKEERAKIGCGGTARRHGELSKESATGGSPLAGERVAVPQVGAPAWPSRVAVSVGVIETRGRGLTEEMDLAP